MSATADPAFEVAVIKPARSRGGYPSINTHARPFSVTNATVLDLIKFSYRVREEQIKGGPPWMGETKFDILAEADLPGQPTPDQDRSMLRKLLAERFHLLVHQTQTISPVYVLALADGQPKMSRSSLQAGHNTMQLKKLDDDTTEIKFQFTSMSDLLYTLMDSITDRQIVDQTGLKGRYDFALVVPSAALEGDADPDQLSAALFKALQSIGLEIKRTKGPVRQIVIDHLDLPTPN